MADTRRTAARCGRRPGPRRGRPARPGRARDPPADAIRARPVHQPASVPAAAAVRPGGDPGEHRGRLCRRGRVPAQGHAARDRDAGIGQHPDGGRTLHPLRVRPGRRLGAPTAPPDPQEERADVRRRPVAADLRRGGGGVPAGHHGLRPHRCGLHPLRGATRALRRDRDRQPLRRHPHRSWWGDRRRRRFRGVGQPEPGPHGAVHVRAGARDGAGHRRDRSGQPVGGHRLGGADVRVPGRVGGREQPERYTGSTSEIGDAVAAAVA